MIDFYFQFLYTGTVAGFDKIGYKLHPLLPDKIHFRKQLESLATMGREFEVVGLEEYCKSKICIFSLGGSMDGPQTKAEGVSKVRMV